MRILYFGTPEFAVPALRALAASGQQLVGVVSQPDRPRGRGRTLEDTPVKTAATALGVDVLQPEKVGDEAALAWMRAREPELGVVVAFGQFIPKSVRELPRLGLINGHASLLPRWRGAAPIEWAIDAGDARTGVSVMRVVKEMDAGDVCLTRETPIGAGRDRGRAHRAPVASSPARRWSRRSRRSRQGRARFVPQDPGAVTLAPKLDRGFAKLDFTLPAERLLRRIRAATPRPGVDIELVRAAKRMRIVRARLSTPHGGSARPGALRVDAGRLLLAAGDAWLELSEIQIAGKRPMRADELLRGFRVPDAEEARTP